MVVATGKTFGNQREYVVFDIKKLNMKGCLKQPFFYIKLCGL